MILFDPGATLAVLAARHPHLNRYAHLGFELYPQGHGAGIIGLRNTRQTLRVRLADGHVTG